MTFFPDPTAPFPANFAFSTLILPSVSVGSIGQLATDVLITTCALERVGFLEFPEVVPVVGNDCFSDVCTGVIHVGLEVYQDIKNAFTVVQQRSPVLRGFKDKFVARLIEWIKQASFAQVFLLTGADSARMTDEQVVLPGFRYAVTSLVTREQRDLYARVHWAPLDPLDDTRPRPNVDIKLYGAGITRRLLQQAERARIALTCLILFTSEGNTVQDGMSMAAALDLHLSVAAHSAQLPAGQPIDWKQPRSWTHLFGVDLNPSLYS